MGADVYVRTWYRRRTGWFGRAVRAHRAWVEVGGVRREDVVDVGHADTALRRAVDEAYRDKYGAASAGSMTTDGAAATTLRLVARAS